MIKFDIRKHNLIGGHLKVGQKFRIDRHSNEWGSMSVHVNGYFNITITMVKDDDVEYHCDSNIGEYRDTERRVSLGQLNKCVREGFWRPIAEFPIDYEELFN